MPATARWKPINVRLRMAGSSCGSASRRVRIAWMASTGRWKLGSVSISSSSLAMLSTKVHLAADGGARPLLFTITAGHAGDAPAFETVMSRIRVPRSGLGRPRTRPLAPPADRACSSRAIRSHLRRRGIRAVIPQPPDQISHRLRRGRTGRPPGFDRETYKQRNTVERCINRLKQWHGPATRTDKLAIAHQAALHLAGILIWIRR